MTRKISLYIIVLLCSSCSCSNIKKYPFQYGTANPTSYIYNLPLELLKKNIIDDFESLLSPDIEEIMCRRMTVYQETDRPIYDSIFNVEENIHDIILSSGNFEHTTLGYSNVYFLGSKPLLYKAEFQLHFEKITDTSTQVRIITLNSKVIVGMQHISIPSHRGFKYKSVEPTTIEEYKILLRIGKLVGEKKMPSLKMPEQRYIIP